MFESLLGLFVTALVIFLAVMHCGAAMSVGGEFVHFSGFLM